MTCQQSTTKSPCHSELKTSAATTSAKEMITRPKETYEMNEHTNIVKALNLFLNTTRLKNEDLEWYIARFERNYAEVKKLGESLSSTCLSVLLLRQAQLSETDNQIISMNLEFDPRANNANQSFESCKASMRRLQHNKKASHQVTGNRSEQSTTSTVNVNPENNDDLDQEQKEPIRVSSGNTAARGRRRRRRRGGVKRKYTGDDLILIQEPEDQTTQEEKEQEILTLITTKVTETEAELQPLNKLF